MHYDYAVYTRNSIIQVAELIFALFVIIHTVVFYSRLFLNKKGSKTAFLKGLIIVTVACILLSISASKLFHGGMSVFFEDETDGVQVQGEISHVEELGHWGVPRLKFDGGSGTLLTINGIICRTIVDVPLDVGNYVQVTYLPKSGYILSIEEIPKTGDVPPS